MIGNIFLVVIFIGVIYLIKRNWSDLKPAFLGLLTLIIGLFIVLGVLYLFSSISYNLPSPTEMETCEQFLARLQAEGELDCSQFTSAEVWDVIDTHTETFADPDTGVEFDWTKVQHDALVWHWPTLDVVGFENARLEYETQYGKYQSARLVMTSEATAKVTGLVFSSIIIPMLIGLILNLLPGTKGKLAAILGQLLMVIVPWTIAWIASFQVPAGDLEVVGDIFWGGATLIFGIAFLAWIADLVSAVLRVISSKNLAVGIIVDIVAAIVVAVATYARTGALLSAATGAELLNALANSQASAIQLTLQFQLGIVFGVALLALPKRILRLFF